MTTKTSMQPPAQSATTPPLPGTLWAEQGGIYLGAMKGIDGKPGYHLIAPATDDGLNAAVAWGGYGKTVQGAQCDRDGLANTLALIESSETGPHPAAAWAHSLVIGEHSDFYLPSHAEAMLGWIHAPQLFQDGIYWTSTQYSSDSAWFQTSDGSSNIGSKGSEFEARAVRRSVIE